MAGAGRRKNAVRAERRALRFALLASLLFHGGLLLWVRGLPPKARGPEAPLVFTVVERPARPANPRAPASKPKPSSLKGGASASARPAGPPGVPAGLPSGPASMMPVQDVPLAKPTTPGLTLRDMSEKSAEAVVKQRGPQHAPGDSPAERLTESLARGTGAMAVQHNGYWDAYFTQLRKAVLKAWVGEQPHPHLDWKATTRVRLVLDSEGLLRDFDVILGSGSAAMDREVVDALHQTTQFPPPPDNVMHGKVELVTEWELTVNPGLAPKQGAPVFDRFGPSINFDAIALANPKVDLTPLDFTVVLATYWTR